jgi:EAL domain-containing protein (putative c-di-GMP-specific phosphodiesterase class I)
VAVSASLGIALYPAHGDTADELLKNADAAMYDAKQSGRNTFSFYRKDMNGSVSQRFLLKTKLAKAVENGELDVHYQPQVGARGGALVGMEALLRWSNPELGRVSPDRFIPLAEESGLIVPIGEWVLRTACTLGRSLIDSAIRVERISVNLSARQFYQANLARVIERMLAETRLPPSCLELEITESIMMGHTEKVLRIMRELKEMKVSLAVDDFGTGYSSLGYLRHFPIDRLKIDRSFINDVPSNRHDCTITNAIIALGHNLGLTVIAEGVETSEQLAFLAQNGCDEIQGYLISRPLDETALRQYLSSARALDPGESSERAPTRC